MEGLIRLYGRDLNNAYLAPIVSQHTAKLFRDADPLTDFWEWYELEYEGSLERGVQSSELERIYIGWCETQKIRYVKRGKAFAKACEAKELESKKTSRGNIWRKQWRYGGKGPVGETLHEAIVSGDFPEKAPFLHTSTISSNEDDLVEEEVDLPIDGEGL
jgi:phage/plasmid-associated DNA primase